MATFQGSAADAARSRALAARRVEDRERFEQQLQVLGEQADAVSAANVPLSQRFRAGGTFVGEARADASATPAAAAAATAAAPSATETVEVNSGLVTLEEFRKRKFAALGKNDDRPDSSRNGRTADASLNGSKSSEAGVDNMSEAELLLSAAADDARRATVAEQQARAESLTKRRRVVASAGKLSFNLDEGEDGDDDDDEAGSVDGSLILSRVVKNPNVETSFLPDRERDDRNRKERERLEGILSAEQHKRQQEAISVPYSYFDGMDHHNAQRLRRGNTVAQFVMLVIQDVYRQLRAVGVGGVLVVWEDLILPHDVSFYDLLLSGAVRTKVSSPRCKVPIGEPLFDFDRPRKLQQATVVQTSWYERNKFSAPACFWETFDPTRDGEHYALASAASGGASSLR